MFIPLSLYCVGRGEKEDRLAYHHLFCLFTVAYFNSLMHKVNTLDRLLVLFMVVWITLVLMLRDILIPNEYFCLISIQNMSNFSLRVLKSSFCRPTGVWLRNIAPSAPKRMSPGELNCKHLLAPKIFKWLFWLLFMFLMAANKNMILLDIAYNSLLHVSLECLLLIGQFRHYLGQIFYIFKLFNWSLSREQDWFPT